VQNLINLSAARFMRYRVYRQQRLVHSNPVVANANSKTENVTFEVLKCF